jgi:plastocyanin
MKLPTAVAATLVGLGLTANMACGDSTYGGGGGGRSTTITVGNNVFSPTPDTVAAGQVTFSWSTPSNGHTVTWDSGPGTLPANTATLTSGTVVVTLQAGTYQYHCAIHGTPSSGMRGTIVVQ